MKSKIAVVSLGASLMTASTALAHPALGSAPGSGLAAGFSHPWLGVDHLLAMFAVGLLAVQVRGRGLWLFPALFVGSMIFGAIIGMAGFSGHYVELGICLSVVVFGAAVALGRNYSLGMAAGVLVVFGLCHGHAHGTELPAMAAPLLYFAGFVSATTVLHLLGIGVGTLLAREQRWRPALRFSGAAIFCAGCVLLAGSL